MPELGGTSDPAALVPGDPAEVGGTAWGLETYGDALGDAGDGLARIDTEEGWRGAAGDAFRARFDGEPHKWLEAAACFHESARALDGYAATLSWAQEQAREAVRMWEAAQDATSTAQAEHARALGQARQTSFLSAAGGIPLPVIEPPFHDPGEALRAQAQTLIDHAQLRVREDGDAAERVVSAGRDKAPEKPSFWNKVGDIAGDIGDGALDLGVGTLNAAASLGNAILQNPLETVAAAGGIALMAASAGGAAGGVALSATGVGAVAGAPLTAVSAAGLAAGAAVTTAAVGSLVHHAATDDRVSPLTRNDGGDPPRPASSPRSGQDLNRQLSSEAQMGEKGQAIAGTGTGKDLRVADRLARDYGGDAAEWQKRTSSHHGDPGGRGFETHWYENIRTGDRVEFKTKFESPR